MLANAASDTKRTLGQGVLSLVREYLLKRVDFDSQEQLAVSIQEQSERKMRGQTEKDERQT
jgi:hypothetical protein